MRLFISFGVVVLWGCGEKPRKTGQQAVFELIEGFESDPVSLFKFCRDHGALDIKEKGRKIVSQLEGYLRDLTDLNDVPYEEISEPLNYLENIPDDDLLLVGTRIEAICSNVWPKPRTESRGSKSLKDLFIEEVDKFVLDPNPLVCKSVEGREGTEVARKMEREFLGMMGDPDTFLRLDVAKMQEIGEAVLQACEGLK